MADYVTTLVVITGPHEQRARLVASHLASDAFDFNSVIPMPRELDIQSDSSVETGHAALYGDWTSVAGYWMFKEPAQAFGFPFPLASREQVLRCLESFETADLYLGRAKQYHDNVERYGFGDWYGWCQKHWGTKWNAQEVVIRTDGTQVAFRFVTAQSSPTPVLKALSKAFPALSFRVRSVDEYHRVARDVRLEQGTQVDKQLRPVKVIAEEIDRFGSPTA